MHTSEVAVSRILNASPVSSWFTRLAAIVLLGLPLQALAVDLLVSNLVDTPDPAVRGGNLLYSASITNNTSDIAHNAVVSFTLDPNSAFVSVSDAACSYAAGTHKVTCNYATIEGDTDGPGSADVINVGVTVRTLASAGATVNFTASVSTSDPDSNAGNNSLSQLTTLDNGADMALVLSGAPTSVSAGGALVYTAAVSNAGPNPAGATRVEVTLTPNVTYQSASGSGWACTRALQVVTCTRGSAAVGALPAISISTTVSGASTGTITSSGSVSISGSAADFNSSNNTSLANTTVTSGTDLAITKTVSAAVVGSGQPVSFTLLPRNTGPFNADNVVVTDSVPAGFAVLGATGTGWTCTITGQDVSCSRSLYAVGASQNIVVSTTAPVVVTATSLTNSTTISSSTPDANSANNSGTVNVNVVPDGVDLAIAKTKTPNPVAQGSNMVSTIRVTNRGPRAAAAGEVSVVETLPVGETYVSGSGTSWACAAQVGQTITCSYSAALALNGVSQPLLITTTASAAGVLTNRACAVYTNAQYSDGVPGNDCVDASASSTVTPDAVDLQLAKSVDMPVLAWNAPTVTYTLTVTNAGPGSATGVVLADPIPGHVAGSTVVTASLTGGSSTATFSCTTGATVTCTQSGGSMANGSSAIFTVAVTRPLRDSSAQANNQWVNNASVHSNDQGDPTPANNTASAVVQVDPVADVTVTNTVTPLSTPAGTNATFVLSVNNRGPSTANAVTLSDVFTLPSGSMTFISATPSTGSCAAFNAGTNTLNCSLGAMASGATASITVVVRPDYMLAPPSPRQISSTATVATTSNESNTGNNSDGEVLTVTQAELDLLVNNTDVPDPLGFVPAAANPVFPDNVVTYRNVITNRGPSVASGLKLTYVMKPPAGKSMTFLGDKLAATGQSYSNYCDNLNAQVTGPAQLTIQCSFPPTQILGAANATTDLYLDFRVDTQPASGGDTYLSSVSAQGSEPETVTGNNSQDQTTTIKMRSDLQIVKTARAWNGAADAQASIVQLRQPFYWELKVTNNGPGDSQSTSVSDTLPAGLSLYNGGAVAPYNAAPYNSGLAWSTNNGAPTSGLCTGTTTIACSIGLLENGKVATIRIPVVANSYTAASLQNCASVSTTEVDPTLPNNNNCAAVSMQRSSIAGFVYADTNNDGAKAAGEAGIASVSLRLDGVDAYGNAVANLAATTLATGAFSFSDRSPGTYTISETQPAGWLDGKEAAGSAGGTASGATADTISAIVLPANTAAVNYLFGEVSPASLAGYVFVDYNSNAVRDVTGVPATDESAGVTGVAVTLTGTDDLGPVNLTQNSATNGGYSFANLRPGSYQVGEATLGGLTHTGMTVGSKGGNDGASALAANTPVPGATKRTVGNVQLAAGDAAINYNFGESGQGLGGIVYADLNNNGVRDAGEPGIAGVSVTLSGNTSLGGSVCVAISPNPCTIVTDSAGVYGFAGLPASDATGYILTEQSQAALPLSHYADGIDAVGTVNGVTTGSMSNDRFAGIVISTSQFGSNYNFGEIAASLAGRVYLDMDRSNTQNAGDVVLPGVTLTLSGNTASGVGVCTVVANCVQVSDASGNFNFTGLPASNGAGYSITETQPVDYVDAANAPGTGATAAGTASVAAGNSVFGGVVLGAGQNGVDYLFGEAPGKVSGFAYHDLNNNGVKDAGEAGIGGVLVTLGGVSASGATPCANAPCVATTAADGAYTIDGLRNADGAGYTLVETQPTGWLDGKTRKGTVGGVSCAACNDSVANTVSALALNAANTYLNFNFGELLAASIAGRVYVDANLDASFGAGEQLAAVTVTLTGTDDLGAAINRSVQTDSNGNYRFDQLRPSAGAGYTVTETQPPGYADFAAASGSQPGVIGGAAVGLAAPNSLSAIVIVSGALGTEYNFRETGASISGIVYFDADSNNLRGPLDTPLGGVSVTLKGPVTRVLQTGIDGLFSFTGLIAGTYELVETQPGYTEGADLAGTAGGVINTPKNSIGAIMLAPGMVATGYQFGEQAIPGVNGSIGGTVYADLNRNGVREPADTVLAGVTIRLVGTDFNGKPVNRDQQTTAAGAYLFTEVPPGSYTLSQLQPAGYIDFAGASGSMPGTPLGGVAALNSITTLAMPMSGAKGVNYDFREQLPGLGGSAKLGGTVYVDSNKNGVLDAGEALAGVTVTLEGTDANGVAVPARSVLTGADGAYLFEALAPGTYTVLETQPAGYGEFPANSGSHLGSAGGVLDAGPNKMAAIAIKADTAAVNYDFRETGASLAGIVYRDDNHNGVKDAGEPGIEGVTVAAIGATAQAGQAITAADGSFSIGGMPAGTYALRETQPAGYTDGKETVGVIAGAPLADHGKAPNTGFDASAANNTISAIKLGLAQDGSGYLFGERRGRLEGVVYMDDNHNGVKDANEAGIGGVHVSLSGGACAPAACIAVSAADGGYGFDNIGPGRYTLVENQADLDTARIMDGKETAGKAGGTVDNSSFGTAPQLNTIAQIDISEALLAANNGVIPGYLFGERVRTGPALLPPIVSGYVWLDREHVRTRPQDKPYQGVKDWTVTLLQNGKQICSVLSDANGFYQFDNLRCAGYQATGLPLGSGFEIQFSSNGNKMPNQAVSGGNVGLPGPGVIRNIVIKAGDDITEQNLPLDPAGVVYDSVTRQPVAGAVIGISGPAGFDPARHLLGGAAAASQTTGLDGMYQFSLSNDYPSGVYRLAIGGVPAGYLPGASLKLPACAATLQVGASAAAALVQRADSAPGLNVAVQAPNACVGIVPGGADSTQYYLAFSVGQGAAPVVNNHVPLDRSEPAGLVLSKTGDKQQLEFGESLLYTLVLRQTSGSAVAQATVRDSLPAGFALVPGTVKVNGKSVADPAPATGPVLAFNVGPLSSAKQAVLSYRLRAGVGSLQGDGVNRAIAYACNTLSGCIQSATSAPVANAMASNNAEFKVRLTPGVFTEQACVAGKVFVDCNGNQVQDSEELGVPGVRLYLEDGTAFTTDVEGKYSFCGLSPKSHVLKADPRTLPRASRLGTTSSRNLGDAGSLWLDAKNGELLRGDFAETSCSAPVIEQVKARRGQGGVGGVQTETGQPGLRFESKAPQAPRQATDSADQPLVKPRQGLGLGQDVTGAARAN